MKGPSDQCAQMCNRIQQAGIRRVLRLAKERGRADPARDLAIIRRAGVEGYVAAGKTFGMSQSGARSVVLRYDEYAQEILKEGGSQ